MSATKIGNNESGITDDEGFKEKVIELKDGYSELSLLAKKSYQALLLLGRSIELGVAQNTINYLNLDKSSKDGILSNEKREKLCDIGRRIWMTIRSNPEAFRDHIVPPKTKDKNPENNKHTSNGDDTWQRYRAAASGYIRTIAARLILIKCKFKTCHAYELYWSCNNVHATHILTQSGTCILFVNF